MLSACQSLAYQEQRQLSELQYKGISVDRPFGDREKTAPDESGIAQYSSRGRQFLFGERSCRSVGTKSNLLIWPISILWGIPAAAIDADTVNKRDLLMYYQYDERGKEFYKSIN